MRLGKLAKKLKAFDIEVSAAARHFMARRGSERGYTIPAHNGMKTEIPDAYIKALCRHFGIDVSDILP